MNDKAEVELSPQGVPVAGSILLKGRLKTLADHMMRSHLGYAAFTHLSEVDATEFEKLWRKLAQKVEDENGVHLSFTHIIIKALAQCLKKYPIINSTLLEDKILLLADINVGVAVAIANDMLIVPVIKHADRKTVLEIAEEGNELMDRARNNRLALDDVSGGTFTLTNFGMFGPRKATGAGVWTTSIIVEPQSAILGLGGLYQKPVARNGEITIRTMLPTSLTIDHRVINGIPALQFMNTFYELIESPETIDIGI